MWRFCSFRGGPGKQCLFLLLVLLGMSVSGANLSKSYISTCVHLFNFPDNCWLGINKRNWDFTLGTTWLLKHPLWAGNLYIPNGTVLKSLSHQLNKWSELLLLEYLCTSWFDETSKSISVVQFLYVKSKNPWSYGRFFSTTFQPWVLPFRTFLRVGVRMQPQWCTKVTKAAQFLRGHSCPDSNSELEHRKHILYAFELLIWSSNNHI